MALPSGRGAGGRGLQLRFRQRQRLHLGIVRRAFHPDRLAHGCFRSIPGQVDRRGGVEAARQGLSRLCQNQGQGGLGPVDRRHHRVHQCPVERQERTRRHRDRQHRDAHQRSLGMLADVGSEVDSWSGKSDLVPGMLANDTQNGAVYGVPWFGGVRGIWHLADEFKAAGWLLPRPPGTTWSATPRSCSRSSRARTAWARPATSPTASSASSGALAGRWPRKRTASGPPS